LRNNDECKYYAEVFLMFGKFNFQIIVL